ncbi:hypothetical protein SOVF_009210 [Spinacia oleracea]|nr:hypothetical protein SOVF_009210 [Spinacia oleracea]
MYIEKLCPRSGGWPGPCFRIQNQKKSLTEVSTGRRYSSSITTRTADWLRKGYADRKETSLFMRNIGFETL